MIFRNRRTALTAAAVAVVATTILAGCSSGSIGSLGSGTKTAQGVTDKQVKVAAVLPLSGAAANYGPIWTDVLEAYFDYVNDHGGVNGRKISLEIKDSGYDPGQGLSVTKQAVTNDKVFSVLECHILKEI